MREVDSARAVRGLAAAGRRRAGRRRARGVRSHAAVRSAAAVARRSRERWARARVCGGFQGRGEAGCGAVVRALRARGVRAFVSARAVRRDAPAGRVPAHAARGPARAPARRAVRCARLDHAGADAGVAGRGARGRAAHARARDPRRGGGALPRRPRGRDVAASRPDRGRDRGAVRAPAAAPGHRHEPRVRRATRAGDGGAGAMRRWALTFLLLALFVGLWQLVASLPGVDRLILASPGETARALSHDSSLLWTNAWVTLLEALLGLALAVVLGAGAAVGMPLARPLRDAAYPLLVGSQAIPVVVFAPLLVLAFDYGIGPKVAIVALMCFFPITVNLLDGLRATDRDLLKLMRSLGASRGQTLRKVELPACLPYLFSGLRISATVSVIGAVFGEWAGADEGLGRLVLLGSQQLETPRTYAGVVILTVMAVALFALVTIAERFAVPWNRQGARPR